MIKEGKEEKANPSQYQVIVQATLKSKKAENNTSIYFQTL